LNSNAVVKINNVTKSFTEGSKKRKVLDNISQDIYEGEIVILLGKSGSGKSTVLNLLSGVDLPDSGSIFIRDNEINELSETERTILRREEIGFVFQFFNLIPTLTVEENLLLPLELNGKDSYESRIEEMLSKVGLDDRVNSYPDVLSGGEQQRIAIARALIHDPSIILADEPTGNLDYENGAKIIELLDDLVRSRNKTMIMATHSKELIGIADRILSIKNGKIYELEKEEVS
jgi:putative ABC transport system ATP-binding protein